MHAKFVSSCTADRSATAAEQAYLTAFACTPETRRAGPETCPTAMRKPALDVDILALFHAESRRRQQQEQQVQQDADHGGEDDRGNAIREDHRDLEGEQAILQGQVAADAGDQDDRADSQLARLE